MWRYVVWSLRLRRPEYRIAEVPIFLIPILLIVPDASAFLSAAFWEGLLIFLFLFAFGDLINCLADRDLDAAYKPHLTEAVYGLGVRGVEAQAWLSAFAAVALSVHLGWKLDRFVLIPLVAAGVFIAYAYSAVPFRLKGRGLWQLAFYWLGLFSGPMVFAAVLFDPWPAWPVLAVAATYGMTQTGVILVNTAEDYPEDRQLGVRTVIVGLGLARGIALALILTAVGGVALVASFVAAYLQRGVAPEWFFGLVPLALLCAAVCSPLSDLTRRLPGAREDAAVAAVRVAARWVPVWITSLALASLLAAAVCYFGAGSPEQ